MPGEFRIRNGLLVDQGGYIITGSSSITGSLSINSSGSNIFTVDGTVGRLFDIDDSLSGSLFSVNTIAGLPVIEAFSDNTVRIGQFGRRALYVSSSRVGIGKETPLNATLDVSGSTIFSGSVDLSGSLRITGSIYSTFATFSRGGGIADYTNGIITSQSYVAWRAPYSASVIAMYGWRDSGSATSGQVNARRSGSSGYALHTGSNLTMAVQDAWAQAGTLTNTSYAPGDSLEIILSGSGANLWQLAVQVDFVKL